MTPSRVRLRATQVLAVVLLVGLSCAACGSTTRTSAAAQRARSPVTAAGGTFAGYIWDASDVTSVSASWRVPTIHESAAQTPAGDSGASTWIGAQANGGGPGQSFIQIGTTDFLSSSGHTRTYTAFWSDSHHDFHPQLLATVRPGDEMTASLRLSEGRWSLSITDRTQLLRRTVSTREEGQGRFDLALWLEEDVKNDHGRQLPYPMVSTERMTGLAVDGAAPLADQADSTWMALPHGYLGPTPLRGDAFAIVPRTLSAAGARYLETAGSFQTASDGFLGELAYWSAATPPVTVKRETDTFIAALVEDVDRLRTGPWPKDVVAPVRRLIAIYAPLIPMLRQAVGWRAVGSVIASSDNFGQTGSDDALIRTRLGIEQTQY